MGASRGIIADPGAESEVAGVLVTATTAVISTHTSSPCSRSILKGSLSSSGSTRRSIDSGYSELRDGVVVGSVTCARVHTDGQVASRAHRLLHTPAVRRALFCSPISSPLLHCEDPVQPRPPDLGHRRSGREGIRKSHDVRDAFRKYATELEFAPDVDAFHAQLALPPYS